MTQEEISKLVDERNQILREDNESDRADEIEKRITHDLRENFDQFPIDFILETLSHFGQAPNLVYDDNGNWAISCEGMSPVAFDDKKIEGVLNVFVKEDQWFDTIRKAVRHHLFSYE